MVNLGATFFTQPGVFVPDANVIGMLYQYNVLIVPNWTIRIDRQTGKSYVNIQRGDSVQVSGTLGSALGQRYRIDVYGDLACDPSGHGEARWYLGSIDSVATDPVFGQAAFSAVLPS